MFARKKKHDTAFESNDSAPDGDAAEQLLHASSSNAASLEVTAPPRTSTPPSPSAGKERSPTHSWRRLLAPLSSSGSFKSTQSSEGSDRTGRSSPPAVAKSTMIFIDYDDTLLPTSVLLELLGEDFQKMGHHAAAKLESHHKDKLSDIDRAAAALVAKAVALSEGNVIIVTNAEYGWVERTSLVMPTFRALVEKECIEVCSARSKHGMSMPDMFTDWKKVEFTSRVNEMPPPPPPPPPPLPPLVDVKSSSSSTEESLRDIGSVEILSSPTSTSHSVKPFSDDEAPVSPQRPARRPQVISIGDSEAEREALWAVRSKRPDLLTKNIKLMGSPTMSQLVKQLATVTKALENIHSSQESMDLKLFNV